MKRKIVTHAHSTVIGAICTLLELDWNVELKRIFHEANRCVDKLARFCHKLPLGLTFFDSLLACISIEFLADIFGHCSPRLVHV